MPLIKNQERWRDPADVFCHWPDGPDRDQKVFQHSTSGNWWQLLEKHNLTLLVSREYEHLVMALSCSNGKPVITYMPLPHPSGIATDLEQKKVYIASTRNPNQLFTFSAGKDKDQNQTLAPVGNHFYPGKLYMHDLATIKGKLYANATGENCVIEIQPGKGYQRRWWPKGHQNMGERFFKKNYLQLNSIAVGQSISTSYFTASTCDISSRRPGHQNFEVDGKGVLYSASQKEPIRCKLTRPHSARMVNKEVWLDNSGYGELGYVDIKAEAFRPVTKLPGWTRGLTIHKKIAFVGTSKVLPRFSHYAPGLDTRKSRCGVHAFDLKSGKVLASLFWPNGNQIFSIEWLPNSVATQFPFHTRRSMSSEKNFFYNFKMF